jgi:hypothetical protein
MSNISCQYLDIDVPSDLLTVAGQRVEFALNKPSCGGGAGSEQADTTFEFALVRASQCNGNIQTTLPFVQFEQLPDGGAAMTVVEPIREWQPSLVACARTSIRIEYWPKAIDRRFCRRAPNHHQQH